MEVRSRCEEQQPHAHRRRAAEQPPRCTRIGLAVRQTAACLSVSARHAGHAADEARIGLNGSLLVNAFDVAYEKGALLLSLSAVSVFCNLCKRALK